MYSVYSVTDTAGKPMVFSLVGENMTKRAANALAKTMRMNGQLTAVYTGTRVKSLHSRGA